MAPAEPPAAPGALHHLPSVEDASRQGIVGGGDGTGLRIALVCSRFNSQVTDRLLAGALAELARRNVADSDGVVVWVPGAFELPLGALTAARSGRYDAVICLGAVIRGETSHYEFVAGQCAAGIQRVQLETGLPVVFGVLTTESLEQALARSGGDRGDKGADAALTAIEMVGVLRRLSETGAPGAHRLGGAGRAG